MGLSDTLKHFGLVIGVFAIIGAGLGLTGFFPLELANDEFVGGSQGDLAETMGQLMIAMVFLQSVIMALFAGPTVGALSGLLSGYSLQDSKRAVFVGGIGSFVGFYIMVAFAIVIMSMAISGGDGGSGQQTVDTGELLQPALKAGLPTGVVGALAGIIGTQFRK